MTATPIADTVTRLRRTFESGKTRPVGWRLEQLAEIQRALTEHEADFHEALRLDLGKGAFEAGLGESGWVISEAKYASKHLRRWMKPQRVSTPLMAIPGRSEIAPPASAIRSLR